MNLKLKIFAVLLASSALAQTRARLQPYRPPPPPRTGSFPPLSPPQPIALPIKIPICCSIGPGTITPTLTPPGVKYTIPWNPK